MMRGFQRGYDSRPFKIKESPKPIFEGDPYDEIKG
jgi:hypothetical protein